jgi:rhodanese-related sulfurtransferase
MDARTAYSKRSDVTLLDVRESWEWDAGRIEDSLHIPLMQIPGRTAEIPSDRPVVAVCRTGARSEDAAEFLRRMGYDAHNLDGGVVDWTASGLPFAGQVV